MKLTHTGGSSNKPCELEKKCEVIKHKIDCLEKKITELGDHVFLGFTRFHHFVCVCCSVKK